MRGRRRPLRRGAGPVRTGVTTILPRGKKFDPVFAASYALNGNGEMTGTTWISESGFLEGPLAISNTHSVGVVRDAVVAWMVERNHLDPIAPGIFFQYPVAAETWDGGLNDINGFHVTREHVFSALDGAASGSVPFTIPATLAPGTYQLRLFANHTLTRLGTSNAFAVTSP